MAVHGGVKPPAQKLSVFVPEDSRFIVFFSNCVSNFSLICHGFH